MPNDKLKLLALVDQLREAVLAMADDTPAPPGPVVPVKPITSVVIENTGGAQNNVPFTFGQVFAAGDFQPGQGLIGRLGSNDTLPLQVDVKALHVDGSVRHAVVSGVLPTLFVDEKRQLDLVPAGAGTAAPRPLKAAVTARVTVLLGGEKYVAEFAPGKDAKWMDGPVVSEWPCIAALADSKGAPHPHLHVRFAQRCYVGERTRVEVVVENDWAYEPNPQNFTYDVSVEVGGAVVHEQKTLTHYHHARWRKTFWFGAEPQIHIRHDPRYLIDTLALPNYDPDVIISEKYLTELSKRWAGPRTALMGVGLAMAGMPTTGGREDIGLNPAWAVAWLLSQDARAAAVTLGTADLSGSWSMHYRDRSTGLPVSLIDYPYMSLVGNVGDTYNPAKKVREAFPARDKNLTATPNQHDISHQPNLTYMPYVLTGEHYYLEELQFWAMYDVFNSNPGYRENIKGLLKPEQVRGQAWALRTLAEAAYITPDRHPLKTHFLRILDSNLDWYNAEYTGNPTANSLGMVVNGYAVVYNDNRGIGPWQDDFFTSAVGHVAELGFEKAGRLLTWKAKFPILRMNSSYGVPHAAIYSLNVRDNKTSPFYESIDWAFEQTVGSTHLADAAKLKPGELTGYSSSTAGYPSNMQPALAYAAVYGGEAGKQAWAKFMSRSVKPDYSTGPQFAIVPRTV